MLQKPFTGVDFFSAKLLSVKTTTFSNLPYSAFRSNTLLGLNPSKVNISFSRFRFRKTIVSLRAPKHFKVGRQHYSLGNRFGYFTLKVGGGKFNLFKHSAGLASVVMGAFNAANTPTHQPLTAVKTIKTRICLQFKFKAVL